MLSKAKELFWQDRKKVQIFWLSLFLLSCFFAKELLLVASVVNLTLFGAFFVFGMLFPIFVRPIYLTIFGVAILLSTVVSLLLTWIAFWIIFVPVGLVMQIQLKMKKTGSIIINSYWENSDSDQQRITPLQF